MSTRTDITTACDHALRYIRSATESSDICALCGRQVRPVTYIDTMRNNVSVPVINPQVERTYA